MNTVEKGQGFVWFFGTTEFFYLANGGKCYKNGYMYGWDGGIPFFDY